MNRISKKEWKRVRELQMTLQGEELCSNRHMGRGDLVKLSYNLYSG